MLTPLPRLAMLLALLTSPVITHAHHSFALHYDSSKVVTLIGVVTRYAYTSPHVEIDLSVKDGEKKTLWKVETLNPRLAASYDLKADSLKLGDPIEIKGWPAKDGSKTLGCHQLVLSDGRVFVLRRAPRQSPVRFRSIHGFTGEKQSPNPREVLGGKKPAPGTKTSPAPPTENPPLVPGDEDPQVEFSEQMEEASFAIAALKEFLRDNRSPQGQLAEIENLQVAMFNAKALLPYIKLSETALKGFGGEAKAARKAMKNSLLKGIRLTLSIEDDIESGRSQAALAGVEALIQFQAQAHKRFQ